MVDVYIVVYSLLGILICLPALLMALNLLMPQTTTHIVTRLEQTPGKSFFLGIPVTAAFLLWIAITANVPLGLVRGTAFLAAFLGQQGVFPTRRKQLGGFMTVCLTVI